MTRTATRNADNHVSNYDPSTTLIGYKAERGHVFGAAEDGSNCYDGPVPVDAARKLLGWVPLEGTVETTVNVLTADGVTTKHLVDPTRKSIIHPDTDKFLHVPTKSYKVHGYEQWLLQHTDTLLHGDLRISRVQVLDDGAKAFIQFELPETKSVGGVAHRSYFTAITSLDGSLSTTYGTGTELIICGNQVPAFFGRRMKGMKQFKKIRHSSGSLNRMGEVAAAIGLVVETDEAFEAEVQRMIDTPVSDLTFDDFLNELVPVTDRHGKPLEGRSLTTAQNHQAQLQHLWTSDPMVAPWTGTAFGLFQAENTYRHHYATVRNASREYRNIERAVTGKNDAADREILASMEKVLVSTR